MLEEATYHEREVYNMVDLIGELGGVIELFVFVFGMLILPISKQSFVLKASSEFFKARTTDDIFICNKKITYKKKLTDLVL